MTTNKNGVGKEKKVDFIGICTRAVAVAEKLGKEISSEFVGDKKDTLKVKRAAYTYKNGHLNIEYNTTDLLDHKKKNAAPHAEGIGDIKIRYKNKIVFDGYMAWNSISAAVKTHVNYEAWEHKLEEVYQQAKAAA